MTSKAARRRRKRDITLPKGETAPAPTRGPGRPAEPDPRKTALEARCRVAGIPATPEAVNAARSPLWGCGVGVRLATSDEAPDAVADLWDAVCHIRRVVAAYDRACGAPNRHPQCLRILAPAEALMAEDAAPLPDGRTAADRDRAAVTAWTILQGWLWRCAPADRSAAMAAIVDDQRVTNWPGILAVLRVVSDGIRGRI